MTPRSFRYTDGPEPARTGASINSWRLPLIEALLVAMRIRFSVRTLPEGITLLDRFTAAIASSGDTRYWRIRSGSSRTTIVRWLPPNGGGADTPDRVANSG